MARYCPWVTHTALHLPDRKGTEIISVLKFSDTEDFIPASLIKIFKILQTCCESFSRHENNLAFDSPKLTNLVDIYSCVLGLFLLLVLKTKASSMDIPITACRGKGIFSIRKYRISTLAVTHTHRQSQSTCYLQAC